MQRNTKTWKMSRQSNRSWPIWSDQINSSYVIYYIKSSKDWTMQLMQQNTKLWKMSRQSNRSWPIWHDQINSHNPIYYLIKGLNNVKTEDWKVHWQYIRWITLLIDSEKNIVIPHICHMHHMRCRCQMPNRWNILIMSDHWSGHKTIFWRKKNKCWKSKQCKCQRRKGYLFAF